MAQDGQTPISLTIIKCKFLVVNYLIKAMRKQKCRGDGQNIAGKRQKRTWKSKMKKETKGDSLNLTEKPTKTEKWQKKTRK